MTAFLASRLNWLNRRNLLLTVGSLVFIYAVAVVFYVHSLPDLGLKSAFSTIVQGVPEGVEPFQKGGRIPRPQDKVLKVGKKTIHNWPELLNAPAECQIAFTELEMLSLAKVDPIGKHFILVEFQDEEGEGPPYHFQAWVPLDRLPASELIPSILWFLLKLLLFVVGVLVLWKRPNDPASVLFYLLGVVSLGAYMGGYHWVHISTNPLLIVGFIICAILLPPITLHFFLLFPRPQYLLRARKGVTLAILYGLPVFFLACVLLLYLRLRFQYVNNPTGMEVRIFGEELLFVIYGALVVSALWYLLCVVALIYSLLTVSDLMERNQVKCILAGAIAALVPIGYSFSLALVYQDAFAAGGATWPMFAASICFTAAFVISITRYRLMELDQIISSGVGYFFISFIAGFAYYGVVFLGTLLFNLRFSSPHWVEAVRVSTFALILLLVLDLARSRLKVALDQRFNREKYHLDRTLKKMGEAIQQLVDPPTLVQRLLHASADLLTVLRGAVYLHQPQGEGFRLAGWVGPAPVQVELPEKGTLQDALCLHGTLAVNSSVGTRSPAAEIQLRHMGGEVACGLVLEGKLLAFMILGPRSTGAYRQEDLNLLEAFAQITVLALGSADGHQTIEQLNQELQAKIEKIAEQQRRILDLQTQLRQQGVLRRRSKAPDNQSSVEEEAGVNGNGSAHGSAPDPETLEIIPPSNANIVGSGTQVRNLMQMINKVSRTEAVVLIRGESGTGKELLAQAVHEVSSRFGKPFIKVHCAALSPTLLESELFGHVKGAFTGAHRDKVGRFEMANGGTLFLDEIGDIALDVQTKLLRVLQERTIERVGSSESLKVDVRVIAATHQNLEELIRLGKFREDLYYRLNVFPIIVPPLRNRIEDIPELAQHFLQESNKRTCKSVLHIEDDALELLKSYSWPGNIRQLENIIERAVVLVEGDTITAEDLPTEVHNSPEDIVKSPSTEILDENLQSGGHSRAISPHREQWERREREDLLSALAIAQGNKAQAARNLGLARSTLVSKLKKHGLL